MFDGSFTEVDDARVSQLLPFLKPWEEDVDVEHRRVGPPELWNRLGQQSSG